MRRVPTFTLHLFPAFLAILLLAAGYANAAAAELTDDISRQELFQLAVSREFGPAVTIPEHFALPDDTHGTPGWTFGIDVSHYDGRVNWELVPSQGVAFVYVKATQGAAGYDGKFAENWSALARLNGHPRLWRGPYHFLSADANAVEQAQNFLKVAGPVDVSVFKGGRPDFTKKFALPE